MTGLTGEDGAPRPDDPRQDRQLGELLQELRVALPGVQLLFGFLLVVPFNQRFGEADGAERAAYVVALLATVTSSACLIAPAAFHRLLFHRGDRSRIIALASRLLLCGLGALAVAITGAVFLVTHFLFAAAAAVAATLFTAAMLAGLWFVLGLVRREALTAGRAR